jgi:pimeloyl-ACP methyl ester carboxylesterase
MADVVTLVLIGLAGLVALVVAASHLAGWLARRQVPQAGKMQDVPGGRIHFVEMGPRDAPPVLMIHGIASQLQTYTYALAGLMAKDHRVIAVDLPGYGYSTRKADRYAALPRQGMMLAAFLKAQNIERPIVVGHSMGGAIALALALYGDIPLRSLVLLSPLTTPVPDPPDLMRGLVVRSSLKRRIIGHGLSVWFAKYYAQAGLQASFAPEPVPPQMNVKGGAALGQTPGHFITASTDMVALETSLPPIAKLARTELTLPRGILYGGADPLLDPAIQGRPMQEAGFVYAELPGRGHMIPVTAAVECAQFIRRINGEPEALARSA